MEYNNDFYKDMLDNITDGVYFVDTTRRITYWNKGAEQITGHAASEVLGASCFDNILAHVDDEGRELCVEGCPLFDTLRDGEKRQIVIHLHHKDGHRVPVMVSAAPIRSPEGQIVGAVEVFHDYSIRQKDHETIESLKKMALLDPLTQIPNRRYLEMKLDAAFEELKRHAIPFGVLIIDIDKFKQVNDTHGHSTGDEVLAMVAKTLHGNVRTSDMVGRWGGEEFLGIVAHIDERTLVNLANKLRMLVENSYISRNGTHIRVTITIGATLAREDDTVETLIERVDSLLYEGKTCGRNCVNVETKKVEYKKKEPEPEPDRIKKRERRRIIKSGYLSGYRFGILVLMFIMMLALLWIWVVFLK